MNQTYLLLALCARAEGHPAFYEKLEYQVERFNAWDTLPVQAELHGMAPLFWYHTQQANISLPSETERIFRGLYLRHQALNKAHTSTLIEIQNLLMQAGIRALVLKGLALAYKYYLDPALRPISDIDLLLKKEDVLPALHTLSDTGYHVSLPDLNSRVLSNHLTADSPIHNGVSTHVELHHYDSKHLFLDEIVQDDELKDFNESPQELIVNGCTINTPSSMDTLNYVTRHIVRHLFYAHDKKPLSLKWTADILSMVEKHATEIDWEDIQHNNPALLNRLTVLYSFSPLSAKFESIIPIKKIEPPAGANQYPTGWPQHAFRDWKKVGFWRFVRLSFQVPSAWWLHLYYGTNDSGTVWYGHVIYRLRVLRLIVWAILRRVLFRQL